jgi:hypothetical protein
MIKNFKQFTLYLEGFAMEVKPEPYYAQFNLENDGIDPGYESILNK